MTPHRILAAFLAACTSSLIHLVAASQPNVGFEVSINTTDIRVFNSSGDRANARVSSVYRPDASSYNFTVPLTIIRRLSSENSLYLSLFMRPYDYDMDESPTTRQVYQEYIYMNEYSTRDIIANFSFSTRGTNITDYYLYAGLDIRNNAPGQSTQFRDVVSGASVLSHNSTTGSWTPTTPAVFAAQLNEAAYLEYETEIALVTEPAIDSSSETVLCGQDPDLPVDDMNDTLPAQPGEDGRPENPPSKDNSTKKPVCKDKYCKDDEHDKPKHEGGGKPKQKDSSKPKDKACDESKPKQSDKSKHKESDKSMNKESDKTKHKDGDKQKQGKDADKAKDDKTDAWKQVMTRKTCSNSTPTPTPTPNHSSKPCPPAGVKSALLHERQIQTTTFSFVRATLTYGGSANEARPIRQTRVFAIGFVNGFPRLAIGTTDNEGLVTFAFRLQSGQTLNVRTLSLSLDGEGFSVSTSRNSGSSFISHRVNIRRLTWQVAAGSTLNRTFRVRNRANIDIFSVQDRMLNAWVFAKTRVHNFGTKLPHVWFPGDTGTTSNYFQPANNIPGSYISINPNSATFTSAQAHEYGHWFHYLARNARSIDFGDSDNSHGFCSTIVPARALTEGFATAFGLSALKNSRFQETGTGYCWNPYDPLVRDCVEIELYSCSAIEAGDRDLSTDEGRVAAVMRDLVDTTNDNNGDDDEDNARGRDNVSDALNLAYSRVLYYPMRNNPASMSAYWNNLKASTVLTTAQKDAAWNVFRYQYARFAR